MSDIVTTRIFQDGEKNITAQKLNDIVASSTIQPAFVSSKPSTSSIATTDNLLVLQTAGTYAKAPFQTVIDSVSAGINSDTEIWKVRLRSFNAIGNSTFEVDQRNVGNAVTGNGLAIDRWGVYKSGTLAFSTQQTVFAGGSGVILPGTNFTISRNYLRVTLTTQEASLAAGDYLIISQNVEGPRWRELQNDVHSLQVLVRSSVANLIIGVSLRDNNNTHSLTNTLTLGAANTWQLLTLPNLPLWTASGTFSNVPGSVGYGFNIALASGTTYTSPANGTWQNGYFFGAVGQSNFAANPVNSTFDIAFCQHEPGPVCSTPMDLDFTTNYDACLRYYQKTYAYGTAVGTATNIGVRTFVATSAINSAFSAGWYEKRMAKIPTVTLYNHSNGAAGSVQDGSGNTKTGAIAQIISDNSYGYINWTTAVGAAMQVYAHHTADTGW